MLVLSRRIGESICILPSADIDTSMTVADLFGEGPIMIEIKQTKGKQVKLGFDAPRILSIKRSELLNES